MIGDLQWFRDTSTDQATPVEIEARTAAELDIESAPTP